VITRIRSVGRLGNTVCPADLIHPQKCRSRKPGEHVSSETADVRFASRTIRVRNETRAHCRLWCRCCFSAHTLCYRVQRSYAWIILSACDPSTNASRVDSVLFVRRRRRRRKTLRSYKMTSRTRDPRAKYSVFWSVEYFFTTHHNNGNTYNCNVIIVVFTTVTVIRVDRKNKKNLVSTYLPTYIYIS